MLRKTFSWKNFNEKFDVIKYLPEFIPINTYVPSIAALTLFIRSGSRAAAKFKMECFVIIVNG